MHSFFIQKKLREVSKWIKDDSKVLDVGCEEARILRLIKPKKYMGLDIVKKNVGEVKKKGHRARVFDLNKDRASSIKEKFDYILFLDVLEAILDPSSVILDFKKLLAPGGKIIVSFPNDFHLLNKARFLLNKKINKHPFWAHGHLHTFPIKDGQKFLINKGFKVLDRKYVAATKPESIPQSIKDFLASQFPNDFARVTLYLLEPT